MDEVPMHFDMPPESTVNKRVEKTVPETSGQKQSHFNVVLDVA